MNDLNGVTLDAFLSTVITISINTCLTTTMPQRKAFQPTIQCINTLLNKIPFNPEFVGKTSFRNKSGQISCPVASATLDRSSARTMLNVKLISTNFFVIIENFNHSIISNYNLLEEQKLNIYFILPQMNKLNFLSSVFLFGAQDRLLRILKYGKLSTFKTVSVKKLKRKSGEK